jgi:hypothetical protein
MVMTDTVTSPTGKILRHVATMTTTPQSNNAVKEVRIKSMPFVSSNYASNTDAPVGNWVCTRTSSLGPFSTHPEVSTRSNPSYCGQCVSYVVRVCPTIPDRTSEWKRGIQVKGNASIIAEGTAIATFNEAKTYHGHAAIYVKQDDVGIHVYDQWITGAGKSIGPRVIRWNGTGVSNNGAGFYVIEA